MKPELYMFVKDDFAYDIILYKKALWLHDHFMYWEHLIPDRKKENYR